MSGLAALLAVMQKPFTQHHPANELTSPAIHIPEDRGDHISPQHIEDHITSQDDLWYNEHQLYSYNMEL